MRFQYLLAITVTAIAMVLICPIHFNDSVSAQSERERRIKIAEKVKAIFYGLESDQGVLALVDLVNKKKVIGYVNDVRKESFIATEMSTGNTVEVSYSKISKIRLVVIQRPSLPPVMKIKYRNNRFSICRENNYEDIF